MITYNDAATTYDGTQVGYGGFTVASAVNYSVVIRGFADAAGGDYSPGSVIAFIDSPHNLAWSEYVNEVSEAFFTISQKDAKAALLSSIEATLNLRPHVEVHRNGEKVWGGWLGEVDENANDIVFYAYSYLSGYYDLITEWDDKWVGATIQTIVQETFDAAGAKTKSRVHWITRSKVQNPVTTSGGSTGITMPLYRAPYKRILQVFKELAAYAMSDTTNQVMFEITPDGVFNFYKDRTRTESNVGTSFPNGQVRSYRRIRKPVGRRNKLLSVGSSPTDVNLKETWADDTLRDSMGLSEEPIYLSFVRDQDELERVTKRRLGRAKRVDTQLFLSFYRDSLIPFRATGAPYRLGDKIYPRIDNGATVISESAKVVMGQQTVWSGQRENVRLLLGDTL